MQDDHHTRSPCAVLLAGVQLKMHENTDDNILFEELLELFQTLRSLSIPLGKLQLTRPLYRDTIECFRHLRENSELISTGANFEIH